MPPPASPAENFMRLLLAFSLGISAVYALRYAGLIHGGAAVLAEDFAVYWRALDIFAAWPPASPYHAVEGARYFAGEVAAYHPYLNPPFFLPLLLPLKLLPYAAAVAAWYAFQLALWLWAMGRPEVRALWPRWAARPGYRMKSLIVTLPFILNTAFAGQIGLLLAALFVLGIGMLRARPYAAGIVLALLSVKPQLLPAVAVFLLAGRHWRAIAAACLCGALLAGGSTLVWGAAIWADYAAALSLHSGMMALPEIPGPFQRQLVSVYAGLRLTGTGSAAAFAAQAATTLAVLGALALQAYRRPFHPATLALLSATLFLCSPYVLQYDTAALTAAMFLLLDSGHERPPGQGPRLAMILAVSSGVVVPMLHAAGIPAGALILLYFWYQCLGFIPSRRQEIFLKT